MSAFVTVTSNYSKSKAFILCLFLGLFGAHYFYVGRRFRGCLCLFTFNFCMIGWLFDLSTIARGRFVDQYGEYLKA